MTKNQESIAVTGSGHYELSKKRVITHPPAIVTPEKIRLQQEVDQLRADLADAAEELPEAVAAERQRIETMARDAIHNQKTC